MTSRWKRCEDWWHKQTGMKRRGHMEQGLECPDAENEMFSVDITTTRKQLAFINKEMQDAEAHSGGKVPTVVIFQEGKPMKSGFVINRVKDWLDLHGG